MIIIIKIPLSSLAALKELGTLTVACILKMGVAENGAKSIYTIRERQQEEAGESEKRERGERGREEVEER